MVWRQQPVPERGEDKQGCDGLQEKPTDHWQLSSTKFLGVHITEDLTWATKSLSKKAQQQLHFHRQLTRASFPPAILTTFYMGTIECMLTSWINVWYGNCSTAYPSMDSEHSCKDHRGLFPSILAIFLTWCSSKTTRIVKDRTHLSHSLFQLLLSGRWYQSIRVCSARMHNNFFLQWLFVTPWS